MTGKKRFKRLITIATIALSLVSITTFSQLFTLSDYPGGYTKAIFELTGENEANSAIVTMEITPLANEDYKTEMSFEGTEKRENLTLSLFGLYFPGMQYQLGQDRLDFSPLLRLDNYEVDTNKTYTLKPGRLETKEEVTLTNLVTDIKIVKAIFTDPDYPNQRAILGIPDLETRKLLPFLPLFKMEENKDGQWTTITQVILTEFVHRKEASGG